MLSFFNVSFPQASEPSWNFYSIEMANTFHEYLVHLLFVLIITITEWSVLILSVYNLNKIAEYINDTSHLTGDF